MATISNHSARELEILQLIVSGNTNKANTAEMLISEKTVEFHLNRIYTKIGTRTRMLAGMWAMKQGIRVKTRDIPS